MQTTLTVQRTFLYDGDPKATTVSTLALAFDYPVFAYPAIDVAGGSISRQLIARQVVSVSQSLSNPTYKIELPVSDIAGADPAAAARFAAYVAQVLQRPGFVLDDLGFAIEVGFKDDERSTPVGAQTLHALCLVRGTPAPIPTTPPPPSLAAVHLPAPTDSGPIVAATTPPALLNRDGYDELFAEYTTLTGSHDATVFYALVRELIGVIDERLAPHYHLAPAVLERLTTSLTGAGVGNAKAAIEALVGKFGRLFDFTLRVPEIKVMQIGGSFTLRGDAGAAVTRGDLTSYELAADYSVVGDGGEPSYFTTQVDWASLAGPQTDGTIAFTMPGARETYVSAVCGPVAIRVKRHDGAVVWSASYRRDDPMLAALNIAVALDRPTRLGEAETAGATSKKLRGKLIAINATVALDGAIVVIQAKAAGTDSWRVVSAGTSDASGNFTLPYPFGDFVAAQAIVSLTPNSPADISADPARPGGTSISDNFLYLLIKDVVQLPAKQDGDDDCGCQPDKVPRLPGHDELIQSDAYSQDLGGSCINLSTPHRTLREFSHHALVRTSDPDVANYTLRKRDDGGFELTGGAAKIQRAAVDLNNPIKWQDAPDFHSDLSLYQAVTVAAGHVLHYRSEFRADGYSLGDLLYSLPLAPGQKKQIVVLDSSHSLRGTETQSLSQREQLAASLTADREIADQLGGGITEVVQGQSDATTSGVSAGLGAAGSFGMAGASLGVAGGYANANSQASQGGARNSSQYFNEKLRQQITQNAHSYRQQNAAVVTTVQEGQHYAASTEVVANHNHCHALTMMYFEVLRHYAIFQELTNVEECVFVPLLMTHFTADNICKWRDVLARHLLPMHASTYLQPSGALRVGRAHPLLGAFDANDRIRSNYADVDFPATSYDDEPIRIVRGEITVRVNLRRPKTRYDRIRSLPIISKTVEHQEVDVGSASRSAALAVLTGGLSLLAGDDGSKTVSEQVLARAKIFDAFMQLDANYQTVPPAKCIRITNFRQVQIKLWGAVLNISGGDFFEEGLVDRRAWQAYATILGYSDVLDMMDYYFKDRLIAEWDDIFYNDIAPVVFQRIVNGLHLEFITADWTCSSRYTGGERLMTITMLGSTSRTRKELPPMLTLGCSNAAIKTIADQVTLVVEQVRFTYATPHYHGPLCSGRVNDDLLDGTGLYAPENSNDKRNPRLDDAHLVTKLIEHLNSNLEHYNKALWYSLDHDRRYMLLDGFNIQVFDDLGQPTSMRSLVSVVKNHLLSIVGNALVFPLAPGYRIGKSYVVAHAADGSTQEFSLLDHYRPVTPVPPYRISVPTRGVFMEAVKGNCDACEPVQDNTSQDWNKFTTDEPTPIAQVVAPTPTVTDWKAAFKDFATPIVNIQNAPAVPAPGAGLAGLSQLLGKSDVFRDVTGLDANQANAIKTLQSNNETVRAMAESAKALSMQQHNTSNSDQIMGALKKAKDSGGISQQDYGDLVKSHLQQVIDGGGAQQRAADQGKPTLTDAAVKAAEQGKAVKAQKLGPEGRTESIEIEGGAASNVLARVTGAVPALKQSYPKGCWATAATMMVSWQRSQSLSVKDVMAMAGAIYVQKVDSQQGLVASEKPAFLAALGMVGEPPASYTVKQYIEWLNTYGPLWVTTDSSLATGPFSPHARVLIAITGTGSPDGVGTELTFLDPGTGSKVTESFATFVAAFEQMVTDNASNNLFIQVVHFVAKLTSSGDSGSSGDDGSEGGNGGTVPTRRLLTVFIQTTCTINHVNQQRDGGPAIKNGTTVEIFILNEDMSIEATGISGVTSTNGQAGQVQFDISSLADGQYLIHISAEAIGRRSAIPAGPNLDPGSADALFRDLDVYFELQNGSVVANSTGAMNDATWGDCFQEGPLRIRVDWKPDWWRAVNHGPRSSPADDPNFIIVHRTQGLLWQAQGLHDGGAQKVSVHYLVDKDGHVFKLVNDDEVANQAGDSWFDGVAGMNDASIGIEHVNGWDQPTNVGEAYTDAQMAASRDLIAALVAKFSIPAKHIVGHVEVAVTNSHGPTVNLSLGGRGPDPGPEYDWPLIAAAGLSIDASPDDSIDPGAIYGGYFANPANKLILGDDDAGPKYGGNTSTIFSGVIAELQKDLRTLGYPISTDPSGSKVSGKYDPQTAKIVGRFLMRFWKFLPTPLPAPSINLAGQRCDQDIAVLIKTALAQL
jgi:hypothetical protein